MEPVSDPALLDQLNAQPVTDPALISQLEGGAPAAPAQYPGMLTPGNIDLHSRPIVRNPDGSISTVRSISIEDNGKEVLIPTVAADGSGILSNADAIAQYRKTGQHLGIFDNPDNATNYAKQLHDQQANEYVKNNTLKPVTDPALLEQLNAPSAPRAQPGTLSYALQGAGAGPEAFMRMMAGMAGTGAGALGAGVAAIPDILHGRIDQAAEGIRQGMAEGAAKMTPKKTLFAPTTMLEEAVAPLFEKIREGMGRAGEAIASQPEAQRKFRFLQPPDTPQQRLLQLKREAAGRTLGELAFDAPAAIAPFSMLRGAPRPPRIIEGDATRVSPDLSTGLSTTKLEGIEAPPSPTGTSSGVPLKLDKVIAAAQRDWQLPQPPDIKGEIRGIKKAGPQPGQAPLPLENRPGIEQTIESAKGDITRPPEPVEAPSAPPAQPEAPPEASFTPFNVDKDYGAPPLAIPDSEVRGSRSGGADRKVYEIVHFNTPFERVLADYGRDWKTENAQANARERFKAAVRQMSDAEAERFGVFKTMTPEKALEPAKQYFDQIRSQLFAARKAKPAANSVQIEAPDAERALLRQPEPPVVPETPRAAGEIPPPPPIEAYSPTEISAETPKAPGPDVLAEPPKVARADPRLSRPDYPEMLQSLAKEAGQQERGGRTIIDEAGRNTAPNGGDVTGRTTWIAEPWYAEMQRMPEFRSSPEGVRTVIRKALAGEKLGPKQQKILSYLLDEVEHRLDKEVGGEPGSAEALRSYGPGTLGANPMLDPAAIKDFLDKAIKKGFGWANAIQSAPESAKGAIAPLFEYARKVQAAKEIAQRDMIKPEERMADATADHNRALNDVYRVNPRFQYRKPANPKEMIAETERMQRETAAAVMRRKLREEGYAIKGHDAVPEKGEVFREPKLNMSALKDETGRSLRIREDVQDMVDQVVGAHDIGEQRRYNKSSWGKLEAVNHATVGWIMQNPLFHMVTTAGKGAVYTIPGMTRRSLADFWGTATEALNDRAQLRDWVEHGLQPFPLRAKMEITGATPGVIESLFAKAKSAKSAYEVYQAFHNRLLADVVNKIQMSFAQMRLEQLVKQAQARKEVITPEKIDAFKTTAAQESNPVGGNLPREELNRTLYRVTGNLFFSRGLQVSTTRFLTRTIENNEIVRSYAESKGFSPKEAQILTDRNRNFLMTALALDYLLMQTVANTINYTTTSIYDQPDKDGNKGGHFVWENPGAKPEDKLFPRRIYLYPKTDEQGKPTGESVYISNPIRTVRDIIEYVMVLFQIANATKPKILENKSSVTAHFAKNLLTGTDWAGRPLSGAGDVAAETGSMLMPSPAGDLPRYALESYRSGNTSFLAEGLKKIFDPETAIPALLGLQPSVSSKSPDITMKAGEVSKDQQKVWARASRTKQLMRGMDEETRNTQIQSVLDDAEKAGMDPRTIKGIARYLGNEDVSRTQQRKAQVYDNLHPTDQIAAPPQ